MKIDKNHIKTKSVNSKTGEIYEVITTQTNCSYYKPVRGYKGVYMNQLSNLVDISKSAQRLFFNIVKNVDDYNKITAKWKDLLEENPSNISKAKKELASKGFIGKIHKSWVLNPFIVLPRYQTQSPETQYEVQKIYKRYVFDKDEWYETIDEDALELYN